MDDAQDVLRLTERLLDVIAAGDWKSYAELCDPTLTAFEPEGQGNLIQGLEFHRFMLESGGRPARFRTTLVSPFVRVMGDVAIVAYVRLNQRADAAGAPAISVAEETRVWQRRDGAWKHVHLHRSRPAR